jgi:uncharacterized delta-60 repeat protein
MKTLFTSLGLSMILISLCAQQPGDLNTDFAGDGIYIEDWADTTTFITSIGMLSNGNLLISGRYFSGSQEIFAAVLDKEGNPVEFGSTSRGFTYHITSKETATCQYILPDNNILLAGSFDDGTEYHPFVIRLLPNGDLDESFADDGVYINEVVEMEVGDIDIYGDESSYSIVIGGGQTFASPKLIVLDQDGFPDAAFGTVGFLEFPGVDGMIDDVVVDSENDDLYFSGYITGTGPFIGKFDMPAGTPDTDFGIDGFIASSFTGMIHSLLYNGTNTSLTGFGHYMFDPADMDIFGLRVNSATGNTDASFGISGWATIRSEGTTDIISSALMQSDGKYYIGGTTDIDGTFDFMLSRLNENSAADTSFGLNGWVFTDLGNSEEIQALALDPEANMLYAAGFKTDGADTAFVIAAYHTEEVIPPPPVSISDNQCNRLYLYPNPSAGLVTVKTGITGPKQVQVFDMAEKEVLNLGITDENFELNLEMLQPSVYFIRVTAADKQIVTGKLLIH